jgi:alpha-glucosidase
MADNYLWWRDGVIFQVYLRSFADSNGDGIGDLNGLTARLDYLKELGISGIWLSPVHPSPDLDLGYDVSDYDGIHPQLGTMADFDRLLTESHNRGIAVIMDMVLNHTSEQHPWFVQSRQSKDNPYRDWYLWREGRAPGQPPNNWQSIIGGSTWQFDPVTSQYYFHQFYKQQPDLNWRNPELRREIWRMLQFWLDKGVDGFRLDLFNSYVKHADLPDQPTFLWGRRAFERQHHIYDSNQPDLAVYLHEMRALVDRYPNRYLVGETFNPTPQIAAKYCTRDLLHGTFNFELMNSAWQPRKMLRAIQRWESALSPEAWPTQFMNNHDDSRSASRFGQGEGDERLKVSAALLLTLRGTPFIYYGEEIGLRNTPMFVWESKDPLSRRYWPFHVIRETVRGPMQWDSSPQAGFSMVKPWVRQHPDYSQRNVAAQKADPASLYHFYRQLIQLRAEYPVLREGLFLPVTFEPRHVLGYLRQSEEQTILVALNFSGRKSSLVLGTQLAGHNWRLLLSSEAGSHCMEKGGLLPMPGNSACIWLAE